MSKSKRKNQKKVAAAASDVAAPEVSEQQHEQVAAADASSGKEPFAAAWRRTLAASRFLQVLGVVLLAQLVLAGGLYWHGGRDAVFVSAEQLLTFDDSGVDRLQIESEEGQLVLKRVGEGWQLQGDETLPADADKVEQMLATLAGLKAGLPVATTDGAREQLEVADDKFQRHVTVYQGDETLADLYVGTSPGYQRAHVRRAGDDAIVAAGLNVYDLPEDRDGWMDRELLAFNEVTRIETDDFTLARDGEQWQIEAPQALVADHEVAQEPLDKLLDTLQGLRVSGLLEASDEKEAATATATAEAADEGDAESEELSVVAWTVTDKDGDPLTLTVSKQGSDVTVKRSDWPQTFKGSVITFNALNDVELDELLPKKAEDAGATEDTDAAVSDEQAAAADESAVSTMSAE